MPNQPSFNLDQAIAAWRDELTRQPGLTPADLRELEAHLRDAFAELRKNSIREEEAFLLARLRVGPPKPVAFEFAKAAPQRVWAPRLFWLVFGIFAFQIWQTTINTWYYETFYELISPLGYRAKPFFDLIIPVLGDFLIYVLPLALAGFWLARGVPRFVGWLLSSRNSVTWVALAMFLGPLVIRIFIIFVIAFAGRGAWTITDPLIYLAPSSDVQHYQFIWSNGTTTEFVLLNFLLPACLIVLMVWLTPSRAEAKARPSLP